MDANNDFVILQYQQELNLPVFIKLEVNQFYPNIISFFNKLNFSEVTKDAFDNSVKENFKTKILNIELASNRVSHQIEYMIDSDRFGSESIVPKEGYQVYRYKSAAMIIFSLGAREWTMGCLSDFGNDESRLTAHKVIINRFISWSLSGLGIVGFWGVPVDEGMVVMKAGESLGEAIFIDLINKNIISIEGVKPLKSNFKIIRLSSTLTDRNIRMNSEELLGFLSSYCTYFDFSGPSVAVRQLIRNLSKIAFGLIHPQEKFQPRVEI